MSSPRELLEAALVANPDDLAAHAAYADFLTEQGDPRGEYIQVQLALEDASKSPAERKALERREAQLRLAHVAEWLGEFGRYYLGPENLRADYRTQDFDNEFQRYYGGVAAHIELAWARGWIERLSIDTLTINMAARLARLPAARLLRSLEVRDAQPSGRGANVVETDNLPDSPRYDALDVLARGDCLAALRSFQYGLYADPEEDHFNSGGGFDSPETIVARTPRLEELRIYAQTRGSELAALCALPNLNHLRTLVIFHGRDFDWPALANNPALANLEEFQYVPHAFDGDQDYDDEGQGGSFVPLAGVRTLVNSPHLKRLTSLSLRQSDMGDEGVEVIIKSGILKRLKVLDLRHGRITDSGARALAACPDVTNLRLLDLINNRLTAAGIRALETAGVRLRADRQQRAPYDEEQYLYLGDFE